MFSDTGEVSPGAVTRRRLAEGQTFSPMASFGTTVHASSNAALAWGARVTGAGV